MHQYIYLATSQLFLAQLQIPKYKYMPVDSQEP